jgi:hypothetical protein
MSTIPKNGYRLPTCAKPFNLPLVRLNASGGDGRSDKIMRDS